MFTISLFLFLTKSLIHTILTLKIIKHDGLQGIHKPNCLTMSDKLSVQSVPPTALGRSQSRIKGWIRNRKKFS